MHLTYKQPLQAKNNNKVYDAEVSSQGSYSQYSDFSRYKESQKHKLSKKPYQPYSQYNRSSSVSQTNSMRSFSTRPQANTFKSPQNIPKINNQHKKHTSSEYLLQGMIENMQKQYQSKYQQSIKTAIMQIDRLTNILNGSKSQNKILQQIINKLKNQNDDYREQINKYEDMQQELQKAQQKILDKQNVIKVLVQENKQRKRNKSNQKNTYKPKFYTTAHANNNNSLRNNQTNNGQTQRLLTKQLQKQRQQNRIKDLKIDELMKKIGNIQGVIDQLMGNNCDIIQEVSEMFEASHSTIKHNDNFQYTSSTNIMLNQHKTDDLPINSIKKMRKHFATQIEQNTPSKNSTNQIELLQQCFMNLKNQYFDIHKEKIQFITDKLTELENKVSIMMGVYSKICQQILENYQQLA